MARKSRKEKIAEQKERAAVETQLSEATEKNKSNLIPYIAVFLLGFLLYANTVPFGYTLDDKLYITSNEFTKKGLDGMKDIWTNDLMTGFFGAKKSLVEGGRYRPLAQTTHAIEWEFFGKNPQLSHFINIVLYGLIGVVLLIVLQQIFGRGEPKKWWWTLPVVATVLYLAHPLHTEVVANIKSRDEIMSLLFALLAFRSVLKYVQENDTKEIGLSGVWFLLSLLSKESSVTFLGVVPLTLFFFSNTSLKKAGLSLSGMAVASAVYMAIRLTVFSDQGVGLKVAAELMNKPYMLAEGGERLASIFFTMGLYLKLLVWPHPLTHDYYPFHPFRTFAELEEGMRPYLDWSEPMVILSVVAYVALVGYGIFTLWQKFKHQKVSMYGYGILLFFGTFVLFSNLLFDIGAFMNERFLFIPSLGFCLILAHVLVQVVGAKWGQTVGAGILAVLLVGYSGKTIVRNYAWESDRALSAADYQTSDGSAKIKMTMGSETLDLAKEQTNPNEKQRLLKEAEQFCLQSLKIHPSYFPPLDIIGNIYFEMENYEYSVHYFEQAIKKKRKDKRLLQNLEAVATTAASKGQNEVAIRGYEAASKQLRGKDLSRVYSSMGEVYGKNLNDFESSKRYLRKSIAADPKNAAAYQKIGVVHAMTGQPDSARSYFDIALKFDPENARVWLNLGLLYTQQGDPETGNQYVQKAYELDPSLAPKK
mgnify:CR=1 FL=1